MKAFFKSSSKILRAVKLSVIPITKSFLGEKEVNEKFNGMINALNFGAPPHGGIAPGIDRIIMLLAGKENIREVAGTIFSN